MNWVISVGAEPAAVGCYLNMNHPSVTDLLIPAASLYDFFPPVSNSLLFSFSLNKGFPSLCWLLVCNFSPFVFFVFLFIFPLSSPSPPPALTRWTNPLRLLLSPSSLLTLSISPVPFSSLDLPWSCSGHDLVHHHTWVCLPLFLPVSPASHPLWLNYIMQPCHHTQSNHCAVSIQVDFTVTDISLLVLLVITLLLCLRK